MDCARTSLQLETVSVVVEELVAVTRGRVRHLGSGGHGAVDGAAGQDVAQGQVVDVPLGPRRHRPIRASDRTSWNIYYFQIVSSFIKYVS